MANAGTGYRKPPKHTQFKKGTSGNPTGKAKGTLNIATVLENTLRQTVVVVDGSEKKRMSKLEAAVKQLVDKAIQGDMYAWRLLSVLAQAVSDSANPPAIADLDQADQRMLQTIVSRFASAQTKA
jgi:hypothetical protein